MIGNKEFPKNWPERHGKHHERIVPGLFCWRRSYRSNLSTSIKAPYPSNKIPSLRSVLQTYYDSHEPCLISTSSLKTPHTPDEQNEESNPCDELHPRSNLHLTHQHSINKGACRYRRTSRWFFLQIRISMLECPTYCSRLFWPNLLFDCWVYPKVSK